MGVFFVCFSPILLPRGSHLKRVIQHLNLGFSYPMIGVCGIKILLHYFKLVFSYICIVNLSDLE